MAVLTTQQRNSLPASSFGVPGDRRFPIPDKAHAVAAERLLGRAKGLTQDQKVAIMQKAHAKLAGK